MKVVIANARKDLGLYVAQRTAEVLRSSLAEQEYCNLVVATGSSQFEAFDALVQQPGVDWSRVNGFHLDEYLGIDRNHSASFCGYLASRFVDRVQLNSFYFLDGTLEPAELKRQADCQLAGRAIDLLVCGIGENGHLAFNDPPADLTTQDPYLIVNLDEDCRRQQVGEGWFDSLDQVPEQAISMSVQQILKAKHIVCAVPDKRKAQAVAGALEGPVGPELPASALREHEHVTLVLDESSASELSDVTLAACQRVDGVVG